VCVGWLVGWLLMGENFFSLSLGATVFLQNNNSNTYFCVLRWDSTARGGKRRIKRVFFILGDFRPFLLNDWDDAQGNWGRDGATTD